LNKLKNTESAGTRNGVPYLEKAKAFERLRRMEALKGTQTG